MHDCLFIFFLDLMILNDVWILIIRYSWCASNKWHL